MLDFKDRYLKSWEQFTSQIDSISHDLINVANSDGTDLHEILSSLQVIPYNIAQNLFSSLFKSLGLLNELDQISKRPNIGSITGVFFELIVASLVTGYVRKYLPDAKVTLNSCNNDEIRSVSRDPDIFITYQNRYIIFEVKASPKKKDLERAEELRYKYNNLPQKNAQYFVVGGHVTTNTESLKRLEGWSCFTSGSVVNAVHLKSLRLDTILAKAVQFLKPVE